MLGLTKKTGYGLVAITHLATLSAGERASAREISEQYEIPAALLMNVLKRLSAAGYVTSVRGARGGYHLARPLGEITLGDLTCELEGPIRRSDCISHVTGDDKACTYEAKTRCWVFDPVHRVQRLMRDFLGQVTLAEIVDPGPVTEGKRSWR